jgi:hypothetical protein
MAKVKTGYLSKTSIQHISHTTLIYFHILPTNPTAQWLPHISPTSTLKIFTFCPQNMSANWKVTSGNMLTKQALRKRNVILYTKICTYSSYFST